MKKVIYYKSDKIEVSAEYEDDFKKKPFPNVDEWVSDLMSGLYKPTSGCLYSPSEDAYCCLGVACRRRGYLALKYGIAHFRNNWARNSFPLGSPESCSVSTLGSLSSAVCIKSHRTSTVNNLACVNDIVLNSEYFNRDDLFTVIANIIMDQYTNKLS